MLGIKGVTLDTSLKNYEKTKSAISSAGKTITSKETYKKGFSKAVGGVKAGGEYLGEQYREHATGISNIIVFIFLGIGFMAYIFPIIAMVLIGALTFLIARRTIVNTITI